jgi:hypothetical protein
MGRQAVRFTTDKPTEVEQRVNHQSFKQIEVNGYGSKNVHAEEQIA